jgi:hypothetical protein
MVVAGRLLTTMLESERLSGDACISSFVKLIRSQNVVKLD